ncbi:MAG: hypothetical protein M5U34_02255 [Chloroflexi bacterium]|nr:hypothetical protein [Chloroflexota bacterium]
MTIGDEARALGLQLVKSLEIDSNRAEITLFEAARAHAAADARPVAAVADVKAVALLALRQRQSTGLAQFFADQAAEESKMQAVLGAFKVTESLSQNQERALLAGLTASFCWVSLRCGCRGPAAGLSFLGVEMGKWIKFLGVGAIRDLFYCRRSSWG